MPTLMVMGEIRQYMMITIEGGIRVLRAPEAAIQPMDCLLYTSCYPHCGQKL